MERSLRFQARREVLHQMAPKYRKATPSQKRTLLEAFVAATGYVRKYARWLLNHAEEVALMDGRSHLRKYGPEVQHALLCWLLPSSVLFSEQIGQVASTGFGSFESAARFCRVFDETRQFDRIRTTMKQRLSLAEQRWLFRKRLADLEALMRAAS